MASSSDKKTEAFVLRRTNYGETDRILNLLTPEGKIACLAKGVRKEKSKLAGGIELFTLSKITIHESSKSDLNLLTSAKMERFYRNIISDLDRLETASDFLKRINRITDQIDSPEYFDLLEQSLDVLDRKVNTTLIKTWFNFNFARIKGDQINLISDTNGDPLKTGEKYTWDSIEEALKPLPAGRITENEIKVMRLMLTSPLKIVERVKNIENYLDEISYISQSVV